MLGKVKLREKKKEKNIAPSPNPNLKQFQTNCQRQNPTERLHEILALMKTIAGKIISSNSISLFKAASILSNFVSAETGASQAVCAYLRRTSESFNELTQFHKELKPSSKSDRKLKKSKSGITEVEIPTLSVEVSQKPIQTNVGFELSQEPSQNAAVQSAGVESENKRQKKKKKGRERSEGQIDSDSKKTVNEEQQSHGIALDQGKSQGVDGNLGVDSERKKQKERKRKKDGETGEGGLDRSEERQSKKKKRRKSEVDH